VTRLRAAAAVAALAAVTYLTALGNGFTLDDEAIVEKNPAAHSIKAAAAAFDKPYWPPEHGAGQWRPMVILSFGFDWSVSGGSVRWLHASNVLWHAAASSLVVPVLAAYVPVGAALAGAAVFAVHPVHVEAVANLVGRAESMAACFLLAAILLARGARERRARAAASLALLALTVAAVAAALLTKEHAAVAAALILLDDLATRRPGTPTLGLGAYAALAVATVGWFALRQGVDRGASFEAVAPTFFHLDGWGRILTMLGAVPVVARLLVFPADLSPDYHPRVIERLTTPNVASVVGLALLLALALLAALLWRRNRAVAVGLAVAGAAWLPTSNLLFPTGIVVAERALYLPSAGLAWLVAAAAAAATARWGRGAVAVASVVLVGVLALHSATTSPRWKSNRDLVVSALERHPESYRVHQAAARVYRRLGEHRLALMEYGIGAELYPLDHLHLLEAGSFAVESGDLRRGLRDLRRAESLDSLNTLTHQLLVTAMIRSDSPEVALRHAWKAVRLAPASMQAARSLASTWLALGLQDSALAVWPAFAARGGRAFERWIMQASTHAALRQAGAARAALDSALLLSPRDTTAQAQIEEVRRQLRSLRGASQLAESERPAGPGGRP
jgi:tetratricopeptide (TPR) repeat protein